MYKYSVAKTDSEKQGVFDFIQMVYKKRGYFSDSSYEETFGKFLQTSDSRTFTGKINGKLFSTLSVIVDSELGLPLDQLNHQELEKYRKMGRIAEAAQFATDHEVLKQEDKTFNPLKQYTSSLPLLNLVLHYCLYRTVDYLCIATTPAHAKFYKTLGFEPIAEKKFFPSVHTWGVAQALDLKKYKNNKSPKLISRLLGDKPDYSLFQ